jgi:F-type H+-transporting ATPase subunit alpha
MPVERQVLIIYAATHGYLDKQPVDKLKDYEVQLNSFIDKKYPQIFTEIVKSGKIDDALGATVQAAMKEFEGTFA